MVNVRAIEVTAMDGSKIFDAEYETKIPVRYLGWLFPWVHISVWEPVHGSFTGREETTTGAKTKYSSLQEILNDLPKIYESLNPVYHYMK